MKTGFYFICKDTLETKFKEIPYSWSSEIVERYAKTMVAKKQILDYCSFNGKKLDERKEKLLSELTIKKFKIIQLLLIKNLEKLIELNPLAKDVLEANEISNFSLLKNFESLYKGLQVSNKHNIRLKDIVLKESA